MAVGGAQIQKKQAASNHPWGRSVGVRSVLSGKWGRGKSTRRRRRRRVAGPENKGARPTAGRREAAAVRAETGCVPRPSSEVQSVVNKLCVCVCVCVEKLGQLKGTNACGMGGGLGEVGGPEQIARTKERAVSCRVVCVCAWGAKRALPRRKGAGRLKRSRRQAAVVRARCGSSGQAAKNAAFACRPVRACLFMCVCVCGERAPHCAENIIRARGGACA